MPHLPTLLLQISIILVLARLVGWLFKKVHQPQVVGEMVAGLLLGPSVLGWFSPDVSGFLFPTESLEHLNTLSQIGLLLFMFLVGLELDPKIMKSRSRTALFVSQASIVFPFILGMLLAIFLHPLLSGTNVSAIGFSLFLGTAMSITAFPVMARILAERKLLNTHLGTVAIASAALNDVTGWIILAVVVFIVRASGPSSSLWFMVLGILVFSVVMIFPARRTLKRIKNVYVTSGKISHELLAGILLFVLVSAWVTENLGIHALFGAFLAGVIMPKHRGFVRVLTEKLNDIVVVLFLPLFFAFTGLRTSIGLVNSLQAWLICGLIIFIAIFGKFVGSSIAARMGGMSWREASTVGVLMNTRGLIELVLLNIGLDIGVISPSLFAMLVLMALVTTFMTSPLLEWIYYSRFMPGKYESRDAIPEPLEQETIKPI